MKSYYAPDIDQPEDDEHFEGFVRIRFNLKSSTNVITVNADKSLQILEPIALRNSHTNVQQSIKTTRTLNGQFFQILFNENLGVGEYALDLGFKNDFGSKANSQGFFKIEYKENDSKKYLRTGYFIRFLAISQIIKIIKE